MFNLGSMFVEIGAKSNSFDAAVDRVHANAIKRATLIGAAMGGAISSALNMALGAIGGAFTGTVGAASSMNDTLAKTGKIFGESADIITKRADEMAQKFGVSKQAFLDASTSFGAAFKGAGMSQAGAAKGGVDLAQTGMDMARFNGATNEDAFAAISSALRGEFDPIEKYNVYLNAAAIEQQALAMGAVKTASGIDELSKKTAIVALIQKQAADAMGSTAANANTFSGIVGRLSGGLANLGASVGAAVMPAFQTLAQVAMRVLNGLSAGFTAAAPYVETGARMVGDAINLLADFYVSAADTIRTQVSDLMSTPVFKFLADSFNESGGWVEYFRDVASEAFSTVAVLMRNTGATYEMVKIQLQTLVENAGIGFSTMLQNASILGGWLGDNWLNMIADAANGVTTVFMNMGKNIRGLWDAVLKYLSGGGWEFDYTPLLDGFKAITAKVPELIEPMWVDASGRMAKVRDEVAQREADRGQAQRAKKPGAAGKGGLQQGGEEATGSFDQFKSQSFAASDFARDLTGKQFGKDPAAIAQQQLDEQKKAREASERTADATEKLARNGPAALFA